MAKLRNQVIGEISGALGDIVFRDFKGTNVVSMRPRNINISDSPSAIARRARFAMAAKLSKAIRQSREAKIAWVLKTPSNLTTHSYMVQVNYSFVSDISVSDFFRMVPDKNFITGFISFDVRENEINARISPLTESSGINTAVEKNVKLFSVLFLSSPVNPEHAPYSFLTIESGARTLNMNEQLDFTYPLSDIDKQLITMDYQIKKVYSVAITLNENGNPINYSDKIIYTL